MSRYSPRSKLAAIFPEVAGEHTFTQNDAVAFMVYARELLEESGSKARFPFLNLFCNWTVHTELEGSVPGYHALAAASEVILQSADPILRNRGISDVLSTAKLRGELIGFLNEIGIGTGIFEADAGWTMFGGHLFKALFGKRLRYPTSPESNRRARDIYLAVRGGAGARWPEAVATLRLDDDPTTPHVVWIAECFDGSVASGIYLNREDPTAFPLESRLDGRVPLIRLKGT